MIYESFAKFIGRICCFTSFVSTIQGFPKPLTKEEEIKWIEADDLISAGIIGLIKAVDSFDGRKGVLLSTYASRCIENEILMLIRANKKYKDTISLNTVLSPKADSDEMELANLIPAESEEDVFHQVETGCLMQDVLNAMEKYLTPMEQEIIKYRYGICGYELKTQKEVADIFNISRSYISRIESKVLKTLQKNLVKHENDNVDEKY